MKMTREYAIELLKHDIYLDKQQRLYNHNAVGIEAHEMAINALSAIGNIKAEIENYMKNEGFGSGWIEDINEIIDKHLKEVRNE